MKTAIAILLIIVAALGWQLSAEITTNNTLQKQVQELTKQLTDKSTRENLEFQQSCALQAEKVFHQVGWKENAWQDGLLATYSSHYHHKLGKCFMTIEVSGKYTGKSLLDAYERRDYAEYMWVPDKVKKFWEVPPAECLLIPSSGSQQICKSEEEFKEFVAHYME